LLKYGQINQNRELRNLDEEAYLKETESLEEFEGHDTKWFSNGTCQNNETTNDFSIKLNFSTNDPINEEFKTKVNIF